MAEVDKDSKTQPPTGRRRSQARARGEVAKSKEINTAAVILSGLAVGLWAVPALLAQHRENMGTWIAIAGTLDVTLDTLPLILGRMRDQVIGLARPFVITAVIAGVAAQVLQTGFIFRLDRLVPKVTKLNPLNGLKRIFGTDGLVNLVKSMLKLALVGYIAYQVVMRSEAGIEEIVSLSIPEMLAFVGAGVRDTVAPGSNRFGPLGVCAVERGSAAYFRRSVSSPRPRSWPAVG